MNKLLTDLLLEALPECFVKDLQRAQLHGIAETYIGVLHKLIIRHGRVTLKMIKDNKSVLTEPCDTPKPIQTLFMCIMNCTNFAAFANHPIPPKDLITAGEARILEAGIMPTKYEQW